MTQTAQRIEKRRLTRGTGLETLVDISAYGMFILGSIVAIGLLLTISLWGLIASCFAVLSSFLIWLLLRCIAEHLRLQKRIAGCAIEGSITGPNQESIWACSNCGQMLHSEDRCESCGAQIVSDEN